MTPAVDFLGQTIEAVTSLCTPSGARAIYGSIS
jgi:hypothetical protein